MRIINSLFGLVFGIAFASGGAFISLETVVPTYQSWQTMKSWQSTDDSRVLNLSGSSEDFKVSYRYKVDGLAYQNDRVSVATFNDNIGSYQQDMYHYLKEKRNNASALTVWYDPYNPIESVLDPEMRWRLFAFMTGFCSIFLLIGLAVSYSSLKISKKSPQKTHKPSLSQLRKQWKESQKHTEITESFFEFYQNKQQTIENEVSQTIDANHLSWLNKKEWANNRIRSGAKKGLYFMWAFAVFWNGISAPILFVLEDEINKENYLALIGLLFPLVGIFIIRQAWKMTKEWRRYGIIELTLDPFPGSIGGNVGGSLVIKNAANFNSKYKVELECVHSYMSGSGDDRSRRESIKWSEAGYAKVTAVINGVQLRFRFDVPENLPESEVERGDSYYFWRIKVLSEGAKTKLNRSYDIPVFKTNVQSKTIRHDISAQAEELREDKAMESQAAISRGDFSSTVLKRALRYKNKGNEQVFYFPMFRNKFLTIFAAGFGFASYSINDSLADGGIMAAGMLIFSIPFALVALFAGIASIYLPLNNLTVTLAKRKIKVIRRLFIFPINKASVLAADIKKIEIKSTGSMGEGTKQIKHFKLIAHTKQFKEVTIAEDIDGEDVANQLKAFICKRLFIEC